MTPNKTVEYSKFVEGTDLMRTGPSAGLKWHEATQYYISGMSEEVGELSRIVRKHYQGKDIKRLDIIDEMGDVLWYLTALANEYNVSLDSLMDRNMEKLENKYLSNNKNDIQ